MFEAVLRRSVAPAERSRPATGLRDLESIQRMLSGPAPFAVFDMPWAPIFMLAIFTFHWMLGTFALVGAAILIALTWANSAFSRRLQHDASVASARSD
ncbi:hypothetical protein RZS08_04725, partial [Arthrospira platensis SPKY1]|nr:hypothetical protein [Arthrospira platensis SPKY1]